MNQMKDNVLDNFYRHSRGITEYTQFFSNAVQQLAHRYPHMNILEIGMLPYLKLGVKVC